MKSEAEAAVPRRQLSSTNIDINLFLILLDILIVVILSRDLGRVVCSCRFSPLSPHPPISAVYLSGYWYSVDSGVTVDRISPLYAERTDWVRLGTGHMLA
jgi:hypothetical protein